MNFQQPTSIGYRLFFNLLQAKSAQSITARLAKDGNYVQVGPKETRSQQQVAIFVLLEATCKQNVCYKKTPNASNSCMITLSCILKFFGRPRMLVKGQVFAKQILLLCNRSEKKNTYLIGRGGYMSITLLKSVCHVSGREINIVLDSLKHYYEKSYQNNTNTLYLSLM